ncbi:hypothetical protein BDR07DRAFT_1479432 [Suillus spraguei]|nr:hypothetical protein BDR07DRAFT_1479432 [Suillus spraguei]
MVTKSISIQPSLTGYISKGIVLCGKGHISDAKAAFDVASMYTDQKSQTNHFLLLIKAIALFGADQHDEAILLLEELATGCPNANIHACHVVEAYLRVQLGIKASDSARYDEAAEHFTAAVNCSALSSKMDIHYIYEDLIMLFGWDLKSVWLSYLFVHGIEISSGYLTLQSSLISQMTRRAQEIRFPGGSHVEEEPVSRALRLMVRLGQPFDAFLLAQRRVREYKRIASDYNIVAQVKETLLPLITWT